MLEIVILYTWNVDPPKVFRTFKQRERKHEYGDHQHQIAESDMNADVGVKKIFQVLRRQ